MALLTNNSKIQPSVLIDLTFEGDIRKRMIIQQNDVVTIVYNREGLASTITGKVSQIGNGDYTSVSSVPKFYGASGIATYDTVLSKKANLGDYLIIDGSGNYAGNIVVVYLNSILDATLLNKHEDNSQIMSPKTDATGSVQITNIREYKGKTQYSTDYGATWKDLCTCDDEDEHQHHDHHGPHHHHHIPHVPDASYASDDDIDNLIDDMYNEGDN